MTEKKSTSTHPAPFDAWREKTEKPSGPDHLRRLYAAAAKGFHFSETCGLDNQYRYISKFQNMDDIQEYHAAWMAVMAVARAQED